MSGCHLLSQIPLLSFQIKECSKKCKYDKQLFNYSCLKFIEKLLKSKNLSFVSACCKMTPLQYWHVNIIFKNSTQYCKWPLQCFKLTCLKQMLSVSSCGWLQWLSGSVSRQLVELLNFGRLAKNVHWTFLLSRWPLLYLCQRREMCLYAEGAHGEVSAYLGPINHVVWAKWGIQIERLNVSPGFIPYFFTVESP